MILELKPDEVPNLHKESREECPHWDCMCPGLGATQAEPVWQEEVSDWRVACLVGPGRDSEFYPKDNESDEGAGQIRLCFGHRGHRPECGDEQRGIMDGTHGADQNDWVGGGAIC